MALGKIPHPIKSLKHINDISNSNIACNADGLLSRKEVDAPVAWVRSINRGFHHRNLRLLTDFCCRYYGILPDEIWLIIIKKLKFDDVFACSLVSKRFFGITISCKKFVDCMRMSKFLFGFDPDYFDFLSNEIRLLEEQSLKILKKTSSVTLFLVL